jgi:ketosteroid isomerase-like protein
MLQNANKSAFVVIVACLSCAHLSQRPSGDTARAIHASYAEYVSAAKAKSFPRLARLYDDGAMLLPPGRDPVSGRENIDKELRDFVASPGGLVDETFTSVDLTVAGEYAVDVSRFDGHWNVPGRGPLPFKGKTMTIWKRQGDGSWKMYRDMWDEYRLVSR